MNEFIQVETKDGMRRFVNVRYIEEIIENHNGCTIYLAFNCPSAVEQDYIDTFIPYDEVIDKIRKE